jgi:hypothetical protein
MEVVESIDPWIRSTYTLNIASKHDQGIKKNDNLPIIWTFVSTEDQVSLR